jgi:cytochrome P450
VSGASGSAVLAASIRDAHIESIGGSAVSERRSLVPDWYPKSSQVQNDQVRAYDEMRERCPVAWSEFMHWSLFRHADLMRVLLDHETFSNAVSNHLSVPDAMDPPEHTAYREMIEDYFAPDKIKAFAPECREIAEQLIDPICSDNSVEIMNELAYPFVALAQCAFLGWPSTLKNPLISWVKRGHQATFAQDRRALSKLAVEFEDLIDEQLELRRQAGAESYADLTRAIMVESVWNRSITNEEISSILRNWTVGEIGTIANSIGIILHFLGCHDDIQQRLRSNPTLLPAAIDEILRIHGPLVANRRITRRDVEIGGRRIEAGQKITLMWIAANRDPIVFDDPETFRLDRDLSKNLLYGAGIHVCPGAPLARLELRIVLEAILARSSSIHLDSSSVSVNAVYPASGFSRLSLLLR